MTRRAYRFCCCSRDLCNLNFTHNPVERTAAAPNLGLQPLPQEETLVIAVVLVALALLLMGALLLGYRLLKGNYKQSVVNPGVMEAANTEPVDLEDLKLLECIGRGRYGSVFRAVSNQRTVAVKVFSGHHHYATERSVYLLPLLRQHDNMAAFMGAEERITSEGRTEYLLVMEYYPLGCLGVYLSRYSPDWPSCCRMLHSATTGLAFLHAELYRGGIQAAVCHRDINSRNILVRGDLSCVLSDFGLSMTLTRTGLPLQGEEEHCAISEAGTLRYMAPEVLEGAVNLRDCESALKQVDVYALGLVYWETFSRCSDLYPTGESVPEYQMVFQEEVGKQPSFQDMQRLVSRDKQRPSFPWKDSSLAVRSLQDTIEECWDHDAEARLTAQCAAQRLADLLAPNTRSPALYNHRNLAEGSKMAADSSYIEDQVGVVRNITGDAYLAAVSVTTGGGVTVTEKNRNTINYQRQQAQVRLSPEGSDVNLLSTISDSGGSLPSSPVFLQLTQEDLEGTKLDPKEVDKNLRERRCEEVLMEHSEKRFSSDPPVSMTTSLHHPHSTPHPEVQVSHLRGGGGIRSEAPPSTLLPLPKKQNYAQRPSSLLLPPHPPSSWSPQHHPATGRDGCCQDEHSNRRHDDGAPPGNHGDQKHTGGRRGWSTGCQAGC
ncbi:Bone morphogenetic protein receptor type-2 [Merluccius polli]|uniref:receptor protein serine/threonine kinase n=1 Tax=Merluccius polli TaxID=89951 RepID=A0AA47MP19_MERPO|nr:Bone morphogenetic protein receptor type-2 [Merluccius polli]